MNCNHEAIKFKDIANYIRSRFFLHLLPQKSLTVLNDKLVDNDLTPSLTVRDPDSVADNSSKIKALGK